MSRDKIQIGNAERGWEPVIRDGSVDHLGKEGNWAATRFELTVDAREGSGAWMTVSSEEVANFEFKARMMAQEGGGNASIFFRQHNSGQNLYQFDLNLRWQAVTISKGAPQDKLTVISAVNHELVPGRDYDIELAMRGESITTYVGGKLINQVRDPDYGRGYICLTAWQSRTRYVEPCLRLY